MNPHHTARYYLKKELTAVENELARKRQTLDIRRKEFEVCQQAVADYTEKAINLRATIALLEQQVRE